MNDSSTFLLFESGNSTEIEIASFSELVDGSQVDACILNGLCGAEMHEAARFGVHFGQLAALRYKKLPPVMVSFFLKGLKGDCPAVGDSAGLAFALGWAKKVLFSDLPPLAATGSIISAAEGGTIGGIQGLIPKLKEACRILPAGKGWIFYPLENESELPDNLRKEIKAKGLHLKGVASVSEAVHALNKAGYGKSANGNYKSGLGKVKKNRKIPAIILIFILITAFLITGSLTDKESGKQKSLETARFDAVRKKEKTQKQSVSQEKKNLGVDRGRTEYLSEMENQENGKLISKIFLKDAAGITGKGKFAGKMARRLNLELTKIKAAGLDNLKGSIEILEIIERVENEVPFSSISARLSSFQGKGNRQAPENYIIEVEGRGLAEKLIPSAAREMADKITKPEKQKDRSYPNQGFE